MIASTELDELMPFFRDAGVVMEFPQMRLVTVESEQSVLEGRGKIEFPRPDKMIIHLSGEPEDLGVSVWSDRYDFQCQGSRSSTLVIL